MFSFLVLILLSHCIPTLVMASEGDVDMKSDDNATPEESQSKKRGRESSEEPSPAHKTKTKTEEDKMDVSEEEQNDTQEAPSGEEPKTSKPDTSEDSKDQEKSESAEVSGAGGGESNVGGGGQGDAAESAAGDAERSAAGDGEKEKKSDEKEKGDDEGNKDKGEDKADVPLMPSRTELKKTDTRVMAGIDLEDKDMEEEETWTFPDTIEGFGYKFNEEGKLLDIEHKTPYNFQVKLDHKYNQRHYEALGELMTDLVYQKLTEEGLERVDVVPGNAPESEEKSFVFMTPGALKSEKLLLLIHGSGVVRAGQWARSLIINHSLDHGTQIPYIRQARKLGYGCIVFNTNHYHGTKGQPLVGSEHPEIHADTVWETLVAKASAKHIAVVAHSYGGVVVTHLLSSQTEDFLSRVFAVGLTDSVHSISLRKLDRDTIKFFKQNAINWVSSSEPLDTKEYSFSRNDCPRVSAGHIKHEWTSWSCQESVFEFFAKKLDERLNPKTSEEVINVDSPDNESTQGAGDGTATEDKTEDTKEDNGTANGNSENVASAIEGADSAKDESKDSSETEKPKEEL